MQSQMKTQLKSDSTRHIVPDYVCAHVPSFALEFRHALKVELIVVE